MSTRDSDWPFVAVVTPQQQQQQQGQGLLVAALSEWRLLLHSELSLIWDVLVMCSSSRATSIVEAEEQSVVAILLLKLIGVRACSVATLLVLGTCAVHYSTSVAQSLLYIHHPSLSKAIPSESRLSNAHFSHQIFQTWNENFTEQQQQQQIEDNLNKRY